uniref:Transposase IS30-like HTH domain-containing protein n=1 Tax=Eptatretus burgeri TaxID=7764 RepID=A0A8C4Q1X5_EPTBU
MPRLSRDQRQCALGMLQGGLSYREVARHLGCSHQTISAQVDRDTLYNSADDRPRSGRPRVTTARQDRQMVLSHLRDRFRPASRTAAETPGRPYRGPVMTAAHRRIHQRWCQQHQRWILAQWNEVAFSDESRFCVDSPDGRDRPSIIFPSIKI